MRAKFAEFQLAQGVAADELEVPAREVTDAFRRSHVLAPARVQRTGPIVDLDEPALLEENIHVAHTAIHGRIAPGEQFEPDEVADLLWRHHSERGEFQTRLGFE